MRYQHEKIKITTLSRRKKMYLLMHKIEFERKACFQFKLVGTAGFIKAFIVDSP